jgi:zinc/manganese transport system substrate-binding protein
MIRLARPRLGPWFLALALPLIVAGCNAAAGSSGGLRVVVAENFWGSIAAQLAGSKATAQSIITSPSQDPHSEARPRQRHRL